MAVRLQGSDAKGKRLGTGMTIAYTLNVDAAFGKTLNFDSGFGPSGFGPCLLGLHPELEI